MSSELPDTLILGMIDGEWPVHAFINDEHAVHWVEQMRNGPARRRPLLWRIRTTNPMPLLIVPPTPARLVADAPAGPKPKPGEP